MESEGGSSQRAGGSVGNAGSYPRSSSRRQGRVEMDNNSTDGGQGSSKKAPSNSGVSSNTGTNRHSGHFRDTSRSHQTEAAKRLQNLFVPQEGDKSPKDVASSVLKLRESRLGQTSSAPSRSGTTKTNRSERAKGKEGATPGFLIPGKPDALPTAISESGRPQLERSSSSKSLDISAATWARVAKAKQYIELRSSYILLSTEAKSNPKHSIIRAIKNRKARFRERVQLDLAAWDDAERVRSWVEDAIHKDSGELPSPPQSSNPALAPAPTKPSKIDWLISPEELLADFCWEQRRPQQRVSIEITPPSDNTTRNSTAQDLTSVSGTTLQDQGTRLSFQGSTDDRTAVYKATARNTNTQPGYLQQRQQSFGPMTAEPKDGYSSSEEDGQFSSEDEPDLRVAKRRGVPAIDTGHSSERKGPLRHFASKVSPRKARAHRRMESAAEAMEKNLRRQEEEEAKWMAAAGMSTVPSSVPEYRPEESSASESYDGEDDDYNTSLPIGGAGRRDNGALAGFDFGFSNVMVPSIAIDLEPPKRKEPKKDSSLKPLSKLSIGVASSVDNDDSRRISRESRREQYPDILHDAAEEGNESANSSKAFLSGVTLRRKNISRQKLPTNDGQPSGSVEKLNPIKSSTRKAKQLVGDGVGKVREGLFKVEDRLRKREGAGSVASSYPSSVANTDDEGPRTGQDRLLPPRPQNRQHASMPTAPVAQVVGPRPLPAIPTVHDPLEVSSDEERGFGRAKIVPPPHHNGGRRTREPSPGLLANFESFSEKQRRLDRERSIQNETMQHVLESNQRLNEILKTPKAGSNPERYSSVKSMVLDRKKLEYARIVMFSTGIVARELAGDATQRPCYAATVNSHTLAQWNKEQRLRAANATRDINAHGAELNERSQTLRNLKVPAYHKQIANLQIEITTNLTPLVRQTTDKADALNTELATTRTLELKTLEEELLKFTRKRRRRAGRILRRVWFLLLEWTVVGFMWWLWMIVVVVRILRTIFKGVWKGLKWIVWL